MPIIIKNLNYIYNAKTPFFKHALKDVNLTVNDGDFMGIIGHTGSGKSTLVQHLNALLRPTSGSIIVDGEDIAHKKTDLKKLRSNIGMVFQYPEYQLFAETVFDDVAFGIKNFYKKKKKKQTADTAPSAQEIERMVREAIELVGLDYEKVYKKSPFELSGGQKRRVAIAGVIVTRPKVLILDEPTAGLDPQGKRDILRLIHTLKADCSPTVIMISHDMNEIAENCSKVAVLAGGSIVSISTPHELFRDYRKVVDAGMDVPEAVKIIAGLNKQGYNIQDVEFGAAALANIIYGALQGAKTEGGQKND